MRNRNFFLQRLFVDDYDYHISGWIKQLHGVPHDPEELGRLLHRLAPGQAAHGLHDGEDEHRSRPRGARQRLPLLRLLRLLRAVLDHVAGHTQLHRGLSRHHLCRHLLPNGHGP